MGIHWLREPLHQKSNRNIFLKCVVCRGSKLTLVIKCRSPSRWNCCGAIDVSKHKQRTTITDVIDWKPSILLFSSFKCGNMLFSSSHKLSVDPTAFSSNLEDWQSPARLFLSRTFEYLWGRRYVNKNTYTDTRQCDPRLSFFSAVALPKFLRKWISVSGQDLKFYLLAFVEHWIATRNQKRVFRSMWKHALSCISQLLSPARRPLESPSSPCVAGHF